MFLFLCIPTLEAINTETGTVLTILVLNASHHSSNRSTTYDRNESIMYYSVYYVLCLLNIPYENPEALSISYLKH